jgi:hypothetical protein
LKGYSKLKKIILLNITCTISIEYSTVNSYEYIKHFWKYLLDIYFTLSILKHINVFASSLTSNGLPVQQPGMLLEAEDGP